MQLPIAAATAVIAFTLLSMADRTAHAAALTQDARAALIESAEQSCFEGQSKQETNKSRKPEVLHAMCYCFAEKMSYTMVLFALTLIFAIPYTRKLSRD